MGEDSFREGRREEEKGRKRRDRVREGRGEKEVGRKMAREGAGEIASNTEWGR